MRRPSTFLTGFLMVLVLLIFLGCAGGPRGKLNRVQSPTSTELRQNWEEYTVYYRRSVALIFKAKDDSQIQLDNRWVEVTSDGMMEKARINDNTWVREIRGANDRMFGYLVHRYLDDAFAGIVDDNTLKISYYYHRTSGH